jgi:pimeloyl-ACP methyl ester carboxylesterase
VIDLRTVTAPDGRQLGVAEFGDPDGRPVFSLHGTPGSRLRRPANDDDVRAAGLRLLMYDRPGYGESDRHRGRRVVDCVGDVEAIADDLGLDRFHVVGGSGGGPHALAVGACLPDRVIGVDALVSPAPRDLIDFDFMAGMDPENVKEFGWALDGEDRLEVELTATAKGMLERIAADPATVLGDFDIPDSDREILSRPDVAQVMQEALTECVRNGIWGWADDDIAFTTPWGFDPTTVAVPTTVWWGANDVLVPAAHGEWLAANVPDALTRVDHGGHQPDPDTYIAMLYPWLIDGTYWGD